MKTVKDYIRTIPDFPEKGIMFRDVTSVIQDADGLKLAIDEMIKKLDGLDFDVIASFSPSASWITLVTSRNMMPFSGKSGIVLI